MTPIARGGMESQNPLTDGVGRAQTMRDGISTRATRSETRDFSREVGELPMNDSGARGSSARRASGGVPVVFHRSTGHVPVPRSQNAVQASTDDTPGFSSHSRLMAS